MEVVIDEQLYEDKVKISSLAYNRRETRDKQLLGRDPDRSCCHSHSFGLSPWLHGHRGQHTSVLPLSLWIRGQRPSFIILVVWRWHHLLYGSLSNGCLSRVSRRLKARPRRFHHALMLPMESWAATIKFFIILVVWRWPQFLSGFLPNGRLSRVSSRLAEKFSSFLYTHLDRS